MSKLELSCACGALKGAVENVSARSGNRVICYCDDCQDFANHLNAGEKTLNKHGGTEVFQTAPASVRIERGEENLKSLKMTPKGIVRWYTGCCQTPIANTSPKLPFVGLIHTSLPNEREVVIGPVHKHVMCQFAKEGLPPEHYTKGFGFGLTLRVMRKMLGWKLSGQAAPNPFFDKGGKPLSEPEIVNP